MALDWRRVVYAHELGELGGVNLTNSAPTDIAPATAAAGSGEEAARSDHVHGYIEPDVPDGSDSAPVDIDGNAAAAGLSDSYSRGDHAHAFLPVTALDFNKQQLQNTVLHTTGTAPSNPVAGQFYFDGTHMFVYADVD